MTRTNREVLTVFLAQALAFWTLAGAALRGGRPQNLFGDGGNESDQDQDLNRSQNLMKVILCVLYSITLYSIIFHYITSHY